MAEIRPFAALRPVPELVSKIAELPYDVMSTQEARDILKENPLSFAGQPGRSRPAGRNFGIRSPGVWKGQGEPGKIHC